jgi:pimeloyl-ACP methyl ester carboxylesterase
MDREARAHKEGLHSRTIATSSGDIAYFEALPEGGTHSPFLYVFLHGLSSNHTTWVGMMKSLSALGVSSIALDMRGHGYSDKTKEKARYDIAVFASDLRAILAQEVFAKRKVVLVGYSFGGLVALQYCKQYGIDGCAGIILLSANHRSPFYYKSFLGMSLSFLTEFLSAVGTFLGWAGQWQWRKRYFYYEHGQSPGYWRSVWEGLLTMPFSVNVWITRQTLEADISSQALQGRQPFAIPCLIMYSKSDPFVTAREVVDMQAIFPQAQVKVLSHESHFIASDAQGEVEEVIIQFAKQSSLL